MRLIVLAMALIGLGCTTTYVGGAGNFPTDQYECTLEAEAAVEVDRDAPPVLHYVAIGQRKAFIKMCLAARGWTEE